MTQAAAAGTAIAAVDPTALLGDWRLTRRLADRRTGLSGVVRGQLTLRSEAGGHISWVEQGTLLWNGSRLPVSRSYRLLRAEEGWWLYFPDGRSFHAWTPGQWVHHPCREDSYRGLITITGPDRWRTIWEVDGPDKAQRIITWLSRSAAFREAVSVPPLEREGQRISDAGAEIKAAVSQGARAQAAGPRAAVRCASSSWPGPRVSPSGPRRGAP